MKPAIDRGPGLGRHLLAQEQMLARMVTKMGEMKNSATASASGSAGKAM